MKKIFRYLASKLRLSRGCDAPLKAANAIEQEDNQGDTELACAVIERIQDVYNYMSYGMSPDAFPSDKPFYFLILDRPLTWSELAFIKTYHFEARSSIQEYYLDKDRKATYYFHSLHSLYFKRKL
jgi:hypothetical protein